MTKFSSTWGTSKESRRVVQDGEKPFVRITFLSSFAEIQEAKPGMPDTAVLRDCPRAIIEVVPRDNSRPRFFKRKAWAFLLRVKS